MLFHQLTSSIEPKLTSLDGQPTIINVWGQKQIIFIFSSSNIPIFPFPSNWDRLTVWGKLLRGTWWFCQRWESFSEQDVQKLWRVKEPQGLQEILEALELRLTAKTIILWSRMKHVWSWCGRGREADSQRVHLCWICMWSWRKTSVVDIILGRRLRVPFFLFFSE